MSSKLNRLKQITSSLKLAYQYFKDPDTSKLRKILFLFPLLYIISPVDLVSDFAPVLGWLDDTVIALTVWRYFFMRLNTYGKNNADNEDDNNEDDFYTLDDDEYDIE